MLTRRFVSFIIAADLLFAAMLIGFSPIDIAAAVIDIDYAASFRQRFRWLRCHFAITLIMACFLSDYFSRFAFRCCFRR